MASRKKQWTKPVSESDDERIVALEKRMELAAKGFDQLSARLNKASRWAAGLQKRVLTLENENKVLSERVDALEVELKKGRPDSHGRFHSVTAEPMWKHKREPFFITGDSSWKVGATVVMVAGLSGCGVPAGILGTIVSTEYVLGILTVFEVAWRFGSQEMLISHRGWHAADGIVKLIPESESAQPSLNS